MCNVRAGKKSVIARRGKLSLDSLRASHKISAVSNAAVAQLDRALVSEAEGCGFDPRRLHHKIHKRGPVRAI